jgi:hypothetical protein
MTQVRFLNRNRPNWLWAIPFAAVLLPLIFGGCGTTLTPPCSNLTQLEFNAVVATMRDWYTDINDCVLSALVGCPQNNNLICRDCANYACQVAFP